MYTEIKKEILAELRRDTNGAVVGTMFEMLGSEKYINYGVTIPYIKKIAKEYAPNHSLALEMFDSKIRELKLCAIYVDTPDCVTVSQMACWSGSFDSTELLEHCCTMLFYGAEGALTMAREWLSEYPYATLLIAAKRAKTNFMECERGQYMEILDSVMSLPETGCLFNAKCMFLTSLAKKDPSMCEYILNMPLSERVIDEISWQIELNC